MFKSPAYRVASLAGGELFSALALQIAFFVIPLYAVVELHANPLKIGILNLMESLAALMFGLFVGAAVNRYDGVFAIVCGHLIRAGSMLILVLSLVLSPSYWMLLAVMFGLGIGGIINESGVDSALVRLGRDRLFLNRANSALRATSVLSEVSGPGLAGLAVAAFGMAGAVFGGLLGFMVAGACVACLLIGGAHRRLPPSGKKKEGVGAGKTPIAVQLNELLVGVRIIQQNSLLAPLVAGTMQFNAFSAAFQAVFIYYCVEVLEFGVRDLSIIGVAAGVGGLVGAVLAGSRLIARNQRSAYLLAVALPGASVAGMTVAGAVPIWGSVSVIAVAECIFSASVVLCIVLFNTVRQVESPEDRVGQVAASERVLALVGEIPGALIGGALGTFLSPLVVLIVAAIGMVAAVFWPARANWMDMAKM